MTHTGDSLDTHGSAPTPAVSKEWYREAFGGEYLRVYRHRDREQGIREASQALRLLELGGGEAVLDLGCGAGRHLRGLREAGLEAVGLDRSRELLHAARQSLGRDVLLVHGDMRFLPFAPVFRAVLSFFTSFGYFLEDSENERVVAEVARVLKDDGSFLLDLMDRETVIDGLVTHTERRQEELRIEERRWISSDGRRVEKEILVRRGEEAPRRFQESVRMYTEAEVATLLEREGLEIERVVGDFDGVPYRAGETSRMIFLGRKAR